MSNIFLLITLLLLGIVVLLYVAPHWKVLNFVDYEGAPSPVRINRYAARRLLFPVGVSAGCAYAADMRPELLVPLIFPTIISILGAVVWISAGLSRLNLEDR